MARSACAPTHDIMLPAVGLAGVSLCSTVCLLVLLLSRRAPRIGASFEDDMSQTQHLLQQSQVRHAAADHTRPQLGSGFRVWVGRTQAPPLYADECIHPVLLSWAGRSSPWRCPLHGLQTHHR
jgi:hypothetical protein